MRKWERREPQERQRRGKRERENATTRTYTFHWNKWIKLYEKLSKWNLFICIGSGGGSSTLTVAVPIFFPSPLLIFALAFFSLPKTLVIHKLPFSSPQFGLLYACIYLSFILAYFFLLFGRCLCVYKQTKELWIWLQQTIQIASRRFATDQIHSNNWK